MLRASPKYYKSQEFEIFFYYFLMRFSDDKT